LAGRSGAWTGCREAGGGHATEIIWAVEVRGQWYLCVWNSHGDGYYLMSQRCYEQLQEAQWEPFGGLPADAR
jgi:hypothetical protein